MKIVIGNPVEGDDFFGREAEQDRIWRKVTSDNLLILSPRRVGKTSLLRRLRDTAHLHAHDVYVCSFAPCDDELHCIKEIIASIGAGESGLMTSLKSHLERVRGIKIGSFGFDLTDLDRSQWREVGETLLSTLNGLEKPSIVCIDEIPIFVLKLLRIDDSGERARAFLNWFRDLRQRYHKKVRWILAGSIGLDSVSARYRLGDTINDFAIFPLGAFDPSTADRMLEKLARSYGVTLPKEVREHMLRLIGWPIPYYLQLMFEAMLDQRHQASTELTIEQANAAFEILLHSNYKAHFDYWRQRLANELGNPDDGHAVLILNVACRDPQGASREVMNQALSTRIADPTQRDEILRYLLDVLENDGYLVLDAGRHRFRMHWLRAYWQRRVAQ